MLSTFDPDKGPLFKGQFNKVEVLDPAIPGHSPNLVLNPKKEFVIHLEWQIFGSDVPLYIAALDNNWTVEVFAESMGPGPEIQIGSDRVAKDSGTGDGVSAPMVFKAKVTVARGKLPEGNPGNGGPSGIYKLTTCAFLNSNLGSVGYDIAGFAEGPVIKVEDPV